MKEFEKYYNQLSNELDGLTSKILTSDESLSKVTMAIFVELSNHLKQFCLLEKDCLNQNLKVSLKEICEQAQQQFKQNFLEIKTLLDGNQSVTIFNTATLSKTDIQNKTDNYNKTLALLSEQVTNETHNQIRDKLLKAVSDFRTTFADANKDIEQNFETSME